MSESPVHNGTAHVAHSFEDDAVALQAQFDALDIPSNIDPRLLALWIEREKNKIEQNKRKNTLSPPKQYGRKLVRLFPAYIGIAVMCLSTILGLIQGQEPATILQTVCITFLTYTIIGFFVGLVADRCVNDSVETLLREIVKRSGEAGQNIEAGQE